MATPTFKEVGPYKSQYGDALNQLTTAVVNRQPFSYDPATDASYQALAKQYNIQGDRARQNTLGDVASITGGMPSSYAVSAAQQAQNNYNIQLSNMIPSLMQAAYDRYQGEYNMNLAALGAIGDRDDAMYGRWNDNRNYNRDVFESDRNYAHTLDRDKRADFESDRDYKRLVGRDKVADNQWAKEFGLDVDKFNWQKGQSTASVGSGGSGGSSGGSKGGSKGGGGSSKSSSGSSSGAKKVNTSSVGLISGKVAATALSGKKNTTKNNGLATTAAAATAKKSASTTKKTTTSTPKKSKLASTAKKVSSGGTKKSAPKKKAVTSTKKASTTAKKTTSSIGSKLKSAAKTSAKKSTTAKKKATK